uniref:Secreted protein n=1 Tax=Panagrellus redivivus TaxID=6233 RepID=A0A7E4V0H2_PANRE
MSYLTLAQKLGLCTLAMIPVTSTPIIAPQATSESASTVEITSTEIAPRTIIALPPSGNLIHTLRAKAAKTAIRHKPVEDISISFNNGSQYRSYSPDRSPNANVWQVHYPPRLNQVTAFFEKNKNSSPGSVEAPIAAKEMFVLNGMTPTPPSTHFSMDEETEESTLSELSNTASTSSTAVVTVPKKNENTTPNRAIVTPQGKWRPWYLGGFGDAKSDDKFKMPLYHGA